MQKNNTKSEKHTIGKALMWLGNACLRILSFIFWVIFSCVLVLIKELVAFLKKRTFPKD